MVILPARTDPTGATEGDIDHARHVLDVVGPPPLDLDEHGGGPMTMTEVEVATVATPIRRARVALRLLQHPDLHVVADREQRNQRMT